MGREVIYNPGDLGRPSSRLRGGGEDLGIPKLGNHFPSGNIKKLSLVI